MIFCVKSLIVEAFFTSKRIAFHITGPEYDRLSLNKRVLGIGLVKLFLKRTELFVKVSALNWKRSISYILGCYHDVNNFIHYFGLV